MPRLSIILTPANNQRALESTLLSVLENRPSSSEVLVVCDADYRDEYQLDDEVRFVRMPRKRLSKWQAMANAVVSECVGQIVHLLQPGAEVTEGWTDAPIDLLDYEEDVAAVSPVVFAADQSAPAAGVIVGRGGERIEVYQSTPRVHDEPGFAPSRTAGFYRRSSLFAIGGWDAGIDESLADVELGCAIALHGSRCKVARQSHIKVSSQVMPKPRASSLAHSQELLIRRYSGLMSVRLRDAALVAAIGHFPSVAPYLLGRLTGRFASVRRKRFLELEPTSEIHTRTRAA